MLTYLHYSSQGSIMVPINNIITYNQNVICNAESVRWFFEGPVNFSLEHVTHWHYSKWECGEPIPAKMTCTGG